MTKTLVLTFIARDKPGLVERLSDTVAGHGGNWLESRMVHLAEKFAGLARVEIAGDKAAALIAAVMALESEGFQLTVEEGLSGVADEGPVLIVDLVGPDHPGIVREISRCLAERGVSVEEMETDVRGAPMGGGLMFYARARVRMPPGLSAEALSDALEALAATLTVDISLRDTA